MKKKKIDKETNGQIEALVETVNSGGIGTEGRKTETAVRGRIEADALRRGTAPKGMTGTVVRKRENASREMIRTDVHSLETDRQKQIHL